MVSSTFRCAAARCHPVQVAPVSQLRPDLDRELEVCLTEAAKCTSDFCRYMLVIENLHLLGKTGKDDQKTASTVKTTIEDTLVQLLLSDQDMDAVRFAGLARAHMRRWPFHAGPDEEAEEASAAQQQQVAVVACCAHVFFLLLDSCVFAFNPREVTEVTEVEVVTRGRGRGRSGGRGGGGGGSAKRSRRK